MLYHNYQTILVARRLIEKALFPAVPDHSTRAHEYAKNDSAGMAEDRGIMQSGDYQYFVGYRSF